MSSKHRKHLQSINKMNKEKNGSPTTKEHKQKPQIRGNKEHHQISRKG